MLLNFKLNIVIILLISFIIIINAKNYKHYKKTTTTAKPTPKPKPTYKPKPPPTTTKPPKTPKPYYKPPKPTTTTTTTTTSKPMPYKFEYSAAVGEPYPTGEISQSESGNAKGVVTGSYSLVDPDGRHRTVIYKADSNGFRATVETNELPPGEANPADVVIIGTGAVHTMPPPEMTDGYGDYEYTTPEEETTTESYGY